MPSQPPFFRPRSCRTPCLGFALPAIPSPILAGHAAGGSQGLDYIIPFGGPLGGIGLCVLRMYCARMPASLPFSAAILRIVPRARRAVPPFHHFEPRIDPARHRTLRMRHRAARLSMAAAPDGNARGSSISMPPGECRAGLPAGRRARGLPFLPYGPTRPTGLQRPVQP